MNHSSQPRVLFHVEPHITCNHNLGDNFFVAVGGTAAEKALAVNLDSNFYGSFAEIGAGQEVSLGGKKSMIWVSWHRDDMIFAYS